MKLRYRVLAGLSVLLALITAAAIYAHHATIPVLEPRGTIAHQERSLLYFGLLLSLLIIVPVFTMTFVIAWRYRESNTKARYQPEFDHSRAIESIWWIIPSILIMILSIVTWNSSHALDPFKPLTSSVQPLTVQVVALDWKWLFIYPDQHVASINDVTFPVNTPINFQITADAPMNSFWIPQLGGQIYAMPGMSTQLHLMASSTGNFHGSSANISGRGFAGMDFMAHATTSSGFKAWVNSAKQSSSRLTTASYTTLAQPSENNPVTYYTADSLGLYDTIVLKYMTPGTQGVTQ